MKKKIVVTFIDGTTETLDASKMEQGIQTLNIPANHQTYLAQAQMIATLGVLKDGHTKNYACYVAPSQIKQVEIIFDQTLTIQE